VAVTLAMVALINNRTIKEEHSPLNRGGCEEKAPLRKDIDRFVKAELLNIMFKKPPFPELRAGPSNRVEWFMYGAERS